LTGPYWSQLRALAALGFGQRPEAAAALQRHGGDRWGALRELQQPRLRPFLQRLWRPPGALDFECPDQQALVRRILATLDVASWGRALLVASLGRELGL
ncbi:RNF31 ligase, partial [Cephalopterus ornatus]|nr:RNF31 ligase [Cephalopterus ornatus]